MKKTATILIGILCSFCLSAQTDWQDSLNIANKINEGIFNSKLTYSSSQLNSIENFSLPSANKFKQETASSTFLNLDKIKSELKQFPFDWNNGYFSASVKTEYLPGLMNIDEGNFSITQTFGKFTLSGYGEIIKYAYFGGFQRSFGAGGSITFKANDKLSLTAFGNYYTEPRFFTPAMAGYMKISTFGGYADYHINDKWGIIGGVQGYRSMMSNQWEVQPIIKPYYKMSKNVSLGVDVGGLVYQILKHTIGDFQRNSGNPTLPPPIAH